MAFIEATAISRIYNAGRPDEMVALQSVSLSIERQEVVVFNGPSGSGKTSLLSLIGCMARPTSGGIMVGDRNVVKLPEHFLAAVRREHFGFIFQHFNLIRELSILENVMLPLYPLQMPLRRMHEAAASVLEQLKINDRKTTRVKHLSGGEQQRVAIARALVNEPDVIIADEPTAHLDRALSREFLDILEQLNHAGKTVIIATHDPYVSDSHIVSRKMVMQDGRIELQR